MGATATPPPVATPAPAATSTSTPAPSTPVSTPESTPVSTPETPAVETSTPSTPVAGAEPQQKDFPTAEAYLKALDEFEAKKPAEEPAETPEVQPEAPETDDQEPEEIEAKPVEIPDSERDVTPEAIAALERDNPALHEVFESQPEVKGAIYGMARRLAEAEPVAKEFPNLEAAQFSKQAAGKYVATKTSIMLAQTPEEMDQALESFIDEFAIVDKEGKPVLDAQGNPTYGEDFDRFSVAFTGYRDKAELEDWENQLKLGKFASEQHKENVESAVQAARFLQKFRTGEVQGAVEAPDLSDLSDETRAHVERLQKERDDARAQLEATKRDTGKESRVAERQTFEKRAQSTAAGQFGKFIDNVIAEKKSAGAFIPSYLLTETDPKTGYPMLAIKAFQKFNEYFGSIPSYMQHMAELQMQAPSDAALKARLDYLGPIQQKFVTDFIDREIRRIQQLDAQDRRSRSQRKENATASAEPQPRAGSPAASQGSPTDFMAEAKRQIEAEANSGKLFLDMQVAILNRADELESKQARR